MDRIQPSLSPPRTLDGMSGVVQTEYGRIARSGKAEKSNVQIGTFRENISILGNNGYSTDSKMIVIILSIILTLSLE